MTWYGITDFKASLGLDKTTGPVLSALLENDYTDVVILGYTNKDKTENKDQLFYKELQEIVNSDWESTKKFIDAYSNTNAAHNHFIQWIETNLKDASIKADVAFSPVNLKHLNDTQAIYEAATNSLNEVSEMKCEKEVTLYLSPGTPVMAFVWAFAALKHPTLKKQLIASSQPGRSPEKIALPREWEEWHGRQTREKDEYSGDFDAVFHLFGEQKMPSLLGINQFSSKAHVFVNTTQYPADVMRKFMGNSEFYEITIDPFDPENVRSEILKIVDILPSSLRLGFNLTGGTKLMYAGALAACRKANATPFYFDIKNKRTINLNDFTSIPTKKINSVDDFINLYGKNLKISKPGYWDEIPNVNCPERNRLTQVLWNSKNIIARLYKDLSKFNDSVQKFEISKQGINISLNENLNAKIHINNEQFTFDNWPDFAKYLSGGWFEEYAYLSLKPLIKSKKIKDLRIGLELSIDDEKGYSSFYNEELYQELDLTFTDGNSLYIVECKAGAIKAEHVYKLDNIIENYGGLAGTGIIASCFKTNNKTINKRISDSKHLNIASDNNLAKKIESIIDNKR